MRFTDHKKVIAALYTLILTVCSEKETPFSTEDLVMYEDLVELDEAQGEFQLWKLLWQSKSPTDRPSCAIEAVGECNKQLYPNIYMLLNILSTLPVTTCTPERSVLCGMLHCKHLNERLEFGMESVAKLAHSFINKKGFILPCRNAIIDLGINQVDPGLTPDGAICGDGKMCVNQKCMSVSSLRKAGPSCPEDCNGNGWCNSKGHCHCKDGFAPPHCDYPGPGGSMDSGPASDPNARQGLVAALFIIFLGIVPLIAIIALLSYYVRHNFKFGWKKPAPTTYVTNCLQHAVNACKGVGSSLNRKPVSTVSLSVSNAQSGSRDLKIEPVGLISTTNAECITRSNTISKPSDGPKDRGVVVRSKVAWSKPDESKLSPNSAVDDNVAKPSLKPKLERRLSLKNIKNLKLNTNIKYSKSKDQDTESPKTAESVLDDTPQVSVKDRVKQLSNGLNFGQERA